MLKPKLSLSRNNSGIPKKAITTSKSIKHQSKLPLLNIEYGNPLRISIIPQTNVHANIHPLTQTHASTTNKGKQHFRFDNKENTRDTTLLKEKDKENSYEQEQPSIHLFDTVSKLEVQNKVKTNLLEDAMLKLLEKEGELWILKNQIASTRYEHPTHDIPYTRNMDSKYRNAHK